MAKVLTISIPKDKEYLVSQVEALPGSVSSHWVLAIEEYLEKKAGPQAPFWFVPGRDYSHLPIEVRKELVKFGYKDSEVGST